MIAWILYFAGAGIISLAIGASFTPQEGAGFFGAAMIVAALVIAVAREI